MCSLQCCTLQLGVLDWSWPGRPAPSHITYILHSLLHPPTSCAQLHTSHHQPPPATTSHHTSDHKQWSVFVSVSFLQPPYSLFIDYTFPHNTFYPHLMKGIISGEVNNCKYNCWNLHITWNPIHRYFILFPSFPSVFSRNSISNMKHVCLCVQIIHLLSNHGLQSSFQCSQAVVKVDMMSWKLSCQSS